ncbi:hemerythrin domain-containing protein [Fusibacter bizertensis]|uniref:Hemerythrin domain-containing protein n=1 Tax=Fusibacter bizertensis TaxID=1488331 RepID=A0ABT6NFY7_9FIRM|nr:hemerythrin domain-containing protein [Fusibacter bizertensis]MDH8679273.1 hemerythrin domain-containing protein [Fusibacter bizertensis]
MVCWKSEFEYGIPMIDDQHEKMLEICGQLFNLVYGKESSKVTDEMTSLLRELKSCSKIHFETEALLFGAIPHHTQSDAQKEEQAKFIQAIDLYLDQAQKVNYDDYDNIEQLKTLLSFSLDWLIKHILVTDKQFVPFLKLSGQGMRLSVFC